MNGFTEEPQPTSKTTESSRLVIDPRVGLLGLSSEELRDTYPDSALFEDMKISLEGTPGAALRTIIDMAPHDADVAASTVVGSAKTGKSEIMTLVGQKLALPSFDAGLIFRALTVEAMRRGYRGGEISRETEGKLADLLHAAVLHPGRPYEGVDQVILIADERYEYGKLNNLDRNVISALSQNPTILAAAMGRLVSETQNKLLLIGGRSLNHLFDKALARFYIERAGVQPSTAERGASWQLDSAFNPDVMTLFNPENEQELTADLMALILARRIEARVSSDSHYELPEANLTFITGEEAKVAEVRYALRNADAIHLMSDVAIPECFMREMEAQIRAKALNACLKSPTGQLLVESTALYIPDLDSRGVPPEVVEYMSKKNHAALFHGISADSLVAWSVTLVAVISDGDIRVEQGVLPGLLNRDVRGAGGFGWDKSFTSQGEHGTFGEIGDRKLSISSRAQAVKRLGLR